jgi:hypothetical protein
MMRSTGNDGGAVRLATFTWLFAVLAIIGVFGFDGFSILSTRVTTENDAQTAAYAASAAWHSSQNLNGAYAAAVASLDGKKGDKVLVRGFVIDPTGEVHLLVRNHARTILLGHISAVRHLSVALESGDANSIN